MDAGWEFAATANANLIAMRMVIRRATPEDSEEIARVHVDTWKTTYRGIVPQRYLDEMEILPRAEFWRKHVAENDSRVYVAETVAETKGKVCGFISGGPLREPLLEFDGEIAAIYIVFEAQRRGCGGAMMRRLAQDLLHDGLKSAVVWVLERNPACGFYARLGGELIGRKTIAIGGTDLVEVAYGWMDLRGLAELPAKRAEG
jgi:ribosomal protein S18 acetylase RimI-like enzyme